MIDHSDSESFSFIFFCDRCGSGWRSGTVAFTPNVEYEQATTRELVWEREHNEAYKNANLDARMKFMRCECCGRWVYENCLRSVLDGPLDICLDCSGSG